MQGKLACIQKAELFNLYVKQKLSLTEVGDKLGVSPVTIKNHLARHGIPTRTVSEALATDLSNQVIGDWEVTDEKGYLNGQKHLRWKCKCRPCGNYHWVLARSLYSRTSTKCLNCRRTIRRRGYAQLSDSHWWKILDAAKARGLEVTITPEYAWGLFQAQGEKCALSGLPLKFGYKTESTSSLDRKDNDKGYVEGNVQWVHKDINRMKWAHTQEEFVALCISVARHFETNGGVSSRRDEPSSAH
jgi:hypothetical protein